MRNNEIQKLIKGKNEKEKFYILRRELVRNSCEKMKRKPMNYSIRQRILYDLSEDGFNLEEKGTQYIATLATIYYHELKLFRRKDIKNKDYFDLSLNNNAHYKMLGTTPNKARYEINKSINNSGNDYISIEELVYELADKYMYKVREDGDEKNISYTKKLLRK